MQFHKETPERIQFILTNAVHNGARYRIWYGDKDTGEYWGDEYEVTGYIGRSTGREPIPLLVHNVRSMGGGEILTDCIVRIDRIDNRRTLYQHPTFTNPFDKAVLVSEPLCDLYKVVVKGKTWARFDTKQKARRYIEFMQGKRYAK